LLSQVPDGVILFFPSYSYEEKVYQYWMKEGFIKRFEQRKKVEKVKNGRKKGAFLCLILSLSLPFQFFREPRNSNNVDELLTAYQNCIASNFSDPMQPNKQKGAIRTFVSSYSPPSLIH
jgi:hypothetical protein